MTRLPITSEELAASMRALDLPDYMISAVDNYLFRRCPPGNFLTALLSNNFIEAVGRADNNNSARLVQWAELLYNELPSACWGSPEKVKSWLEGKDTE